MSKSDQQLWSVVRGQTYLSDLHVLVPPTNAVSQFRTEKAATYDSYRIRRLTHRVKLTVVINLQLKFRKERIEKGENETHSS